MLNRASLTVISLVGICVVAAAQVGTATAAEGRDLLRATTPGAYSVRYMPDRALISSSTTEATELRVYLPQAPLWGYVDGVKTAASSFKWNAAASAVALKIPGEQHSLVIGWAGTGEAPRPGQKVDLLVDGQKAGELAVRFSLDEMIAEGGADLPAGVARVTMEADDGVAQSGATLSVGDAKVTQWRPVRDLYQGRGHVTIGGENLIRLTVPGYNLLETPVQAVGIQIIATPSDPVRAEAMPEDGIIVEAEDFVDEGRGAVLISEGAHIDQHGGKSLYTFTGDGHWIEWKFEVPADGLYDVFAKISCGEDFSLREVRVDRRLPASGYELVKFPGTGGWAHAPGEWWYMQIAGGSDALPPIKLEKGTHRLRIKGVGANHLNVDYFVVKPRPGPAKAAAPQQKDARKSKPRVAPGCGCQW